MGSRPSKRIMPDLIEIGRQIGAPLLATNDAHYTRRDEAAAPRRSSLHPNRSPTRTMSTGFKFEAEEFYLKSAAEMRRALPGGQLSGCL